MKLELSEIFVYPVKGLGGIRLSKAKVYPYGLEHDRRFMLVNEYGEFVTQRQLPQLAVFRVSLYPSGTICIAYPEKSESLCLPVSPESGHLQKAVIWGDVVEVLEVDAYVSSWFSGLLGTPLRIVWLPAENARTVNQNYARLSDKTMLTDGYPILLVGESSLKELNQHLNNPVGPERFRPSLVFKGGAAYEEDNWKQFKMGNQTFRVVKPCSRCSVTEVNQQTGKPDHENSVLRALSLTRKKDHAVYFGQNVIPEGETVIHTGMEIYPQEVK